MKNKFVPALNYHFLTRYYDPLMEFCGARKTLREKVLKVIEPKPRMRILDVGCGTGSLIIDIKEKYPEIEVAGADIDRKMLVQARKKIRTKKLDIKLINVGADQLKFRARTFDYVISTLVFHHLPTEIKQQALIDIAKMLKPEGKFILIDIGDKKSKWLQLDYFLSRLVHMAEAKTMKDNVDGKIPSMLKEAGFSYKEFSKSSRGIKFWLAEKSE